SVLLLFLVSCLLPTLPAARCYCTADDCNPFGACDGKSCLVGILNQTERIVRTCGDHKPGCYRDIDSKWSRLYACDEYFCNTFSIFRK
ncbi:hypothetical protein PFISCL1PPCAC_3492, partial [Pristionchus fissidentatus]